MLLLLAIASSLVLAACGGSTEHHTLHGSLKVIGDFGTAAHTCWPKAESGLSDISGGTQVVVKNEHGTVIGYGSLSAGSTSEELGSAEFGHYAVTCQYTFSVPNLPNAQFYGVTVAARGEQHYSLSDLVSSKWNIGLSL